MLINDKYKQGVNKELNNRFLAICLPHASKDLVVYINAIYLYVEMEDYAKALECLQQFSMGNESLWLREKLVSDLRDKALFTSFRKYNGVEQAIDIETYITQLVLNGVELDATGYYTMLWNQIKQATSLELNNLMLDSYINTCIEYIFLDYRINFRVGCFFTEAKAFDKALAFFDDYFAANNDEFDVYTVDKAVPEKQKMLHYLTNDPAFDALRAYKKTKDNLEYWLQEVQEEKQTISNASNGLSPSEYYQLTNGYIDAVSTGDQFAIQAIKKNLDEKSLQTVLNNVLLRIDNQLYKLKQWELTVQLFEQLHDYLEKTGRWGDYCLRALWLLQHDNTGLQINRERNEKFIAYSLPYTSIYPAVYFNAACLYVDMEDYDKATHFFERYFVNEKSKEDKQNFLQQLENDTMFSRYGVTNGKDISKWKKMK